MKTSAEYIESLRKLKLKVYMFGNRIENIVDDPIIRPSLNAVAATGYYTNIILILKA